MGIGPGRKSCYTSSNNPLAIAPNPNPRDYTVQKIIRFPSATLLRVKYDGCTNFEGIKLLVFLGHFNPNGDLDPHFEDKLTSPIARFKPDKLGYELAKMFCRTVSNIVREALP